MRNLSLNISAIICLLAAVFSVVIGIIYIAAGKVGMGCGLLFLSTPVCIALAVVFDYVGERIRRDEIEGIGRGKQDVVDTPWENDPDFNPNPSESKVVKYNPRGGSGFGGFG